MSRSCTPSLAIRRRVGRLASNSSTVSSITLPIIVLRPGRLLHILLFRLYWRLSRQRSAVGLHHLHFDFDSRNRSASLDKTPSQLIRFRSTERSRLKFCARGGFNQIGHLKMTACGLYSHARHGLHRGDGPDCDRILAHSRSGIAAEKPEERRWGPH